MRAAAADSDDNDEGQPSEPQQPTASGEKPPVDMKLQDLDARHNLRLYLMKSWNLLQQNSPPAEFTNSEIRKLLMSPPQSPSINSTSKEVMLATSAAAAAAPLRILDGAEEPVAVAALNSSSGNDSFSSDALFIAEDEPNYSILNKRTISCSGSSEEEDDDDPEAEEEADCSTATAAATRVADGGQFNYRSLPATSSTSLKTLKSPLNDGIYTYWAVVTQADPSSSTQTTGNYKINLERYL